MRRMPIEWSVRETYQLQWYQYCIPIEILHCARRRARRCARGRGDGHGCRCGAQSHCALVALAALGVLRDSLNPNARRTRCTWRARCSRRTRCVSCTRCARRTWRTRCARRARCARRSAGVCSPSVSRVRPAKGSAWWRCGV